MTDPVEKPLERPAPSSRGALAALRPSTPRDTARGMLEHVARGVDLPPALALHALELAEASIVGTEAQHAGAMVALLVLEAVHRGSTRLTLAAGAPASSLVASARALGFTPRECELLRLHVPFDEAESIGDLAAEAEPASSSDATSSDAVARSSVDDAPRLAPGDLATSADGASSTSADGPGHIESSESAEDLDRVASKLRGKRRSVAPGQLALSFETPSASTVPASPESLTPRAVSERLVEVTAREIAAEEAPAHDDASPVARPLVVVSRRSSPMRALVVRAGSVLAPLFASVGSRDVSPFVVVGRSLAPRKLARLEENVAAHLARRASRATEASPASPVRSPRAESAPTTVSPGDEATLSAIVTEVSRIDGTPIVLAAAQQRAVRASLVEKNIVVTGGPGTGKTSIVVALLRAFVRARGVEALGRVAIAAPTGKASDRMSESLHGSVARLTAPVDRALASSLPRPETLHRLLGYEPFAQRYRMHAGNPLAVDLVIVDEASMLDLELFSRLLRAVPDHATLLLLGDVDQLPSVEAGAVLRDLLRPPTTGPSSVSVVVLEESHRMRASDPSGAHILSVAETIRRGAIVLDDLSSAPARDHAAAPRASLTRGRVARAPELPEERAGLVWLDPAKTSLEATLERFLGPLFDLSSPTLRRFVEPIVIDDPALAPELLALFRLFESRRVLTLTRGESRGRGAALINRWFGQRRSRARAGLERARGAGHDAARGAGHDAARGAGHDAARGAGLEGARGATSIGALEPVMVTANDYDRGLFNGDTGLVLLSPDGEPMLVLRRGERFVTTPLEPLRAIVERAYAMTVHKAQGSEVDEVLLVMPDDDVPALATREIVYTALTRARRGATIFGGRTTIETAVARRAERMTGLCPTTRLEDTSTASRARDALHSEREEA